MYFDFKSALLWKDSTARLPPTKVLAFRYPNRCKGLHRISHRATPAVITVAYGQDPGRVSPYKNLQSQSTPNTTLIQERLKNQQLLASLWGPFLPLQPRLCVAGRAGCGHSPAWATWGVKVLQCDPLLLAAPYPQLKNKNQLQKQTPFSFP